MVEDVERADAIVLVAEAGGELVGQLGLHLARYGWPSWAWPWPPAGAAAGSVAPCSPRGSTGLAAGRAQARPRGLASQAAIALYERFGFERGGCLRRHYRRRSGELWDAVMMGLQAGLTARVR